MTDLPTTPYIHAKSTQLTELIDTCQLRRIESSIQQSLYRVDDVDSKSDLVTGRLLLELQEWKSR